MDRELKIIIDSATWPAHGQPAFPISFTSGNSSHILNVPAMLLMIGYLTTPTSAAGVSLSEFWAWVRYLAAVSPDNALCLTRSFSDLDSHQKTILSDDFGMGVPLLWLSESLQLEQIIDGRYFMKKVAASVGATQRRTAKRGPNKTPDFVARDSNGRWHVIECKGTQSGSVYSATQLQKGITQKCAIKFPSGHTGQRLVCGLSIGLQGGAGSVLKIIDPEPEDPFEIPFNDLEFAKDAANRGVMARVLRMSGFEVTAEIVASPLGRSPDAQMLPATTDGGLRRRFIKEREKRSNTELRDTTHFTHVFDQRYRGREVAFELPRGVRVNGGLVNKVIIRQGVNRDALDELRDRHTVEELADEKHVDWARLMGRSTVQADGQHASMRIGDIFRSELVLASK